MIRSLQIRGLLILALVVVAIYYSFPFSEKITLGLDLSGGMHLVLMVDTDKAVESELNKLKAEIDKELITKKYQFDTTSVAEKKLTISFANTESRQKALEYLQKDYAIFSIDTAGTMDKPLIVMSISDNRQVEIKEQAFEQALETIRNRIDETGVKEPIIQRQGIAGDRILVQLAGIDDPERAKKIIGKTAYLEFRLVKSGPASKEELLKQYDNKVPFGYELFPNADPSSSQQTFYLLEKAATVTGADLEKAQVGRGQYNQYTVDFELSKFGARKFGDLTGANIGQFLAIVLDGKVQSAPRVQARITNSGQITGNFSYEEARDLAIVLRAGALPAPVVYLEERTVGPSMGRDSIQMGGLAFIIGCVLIVLFMVVYYKTSGLIADLALLLNVLFILGGLGGLHATLTMPGIAGIVLTLGMAVDANVLIYERIREEMRAGKTIRTAISAGFARAFTTILDSNVTTIIAAAVLMNFGSGPIRGFAITLIMGLLSSMFTAIVVSRVIFDTILLNKQKTTISI